MDHREPPVHQRLLRRVLARPVASVADAVVPVVVDAVDLNDAVNRIEINELIDRPELRPGPSALRAGRSCRTPGSSPLAPSVQPSVHAQVPAGEAGDGQAAQAEREQGEDGEVPQGEPVGDGVHAERVVPR